MTSRHMKLKYYLKDKKGIRKKQKQRRSASASAFPFLKKKELFLSKNPSVWQKKKFYYRHYKGFRFKMSVRYLRALLTKPPKLPLYIDFVRWLIVDFLRGKTRGFSGISCFVAMPGEGKTISMVHHIESYKKKIPNLYVATNFNYVCQDAAIDHWTDVIKVSKYCTAHHLKHIVAIDEIHLTFDASNYKILPQEFVSLLSFNRKFSMQFLCSCQFYDWIPSKIRKISNYIVICKNIMKSDRLFINYYFDMLNYESSFSGKRSKAEYVIQYVASDSLYACYDTLQQVDRMMADAQTEKDKRQEAIDLLFHQNHSGDAETDVEQANRSVSASNE